MRTHAKIIFALLLGILAACGDDDPMSPDPKTDDRLELSDTSLVITQIGDTAVLNASVGTQSTYTPNLVLHQENRWLSELSVLDDTLLAEGRIVARGPGNAVLLVSAFGKGPDTVYVSVTPSRPAVLSIDAPARVGDGDTITLRGYQMDELATSGAITVLDVPVTIFSADSATLRMGIPTLASDSTCSPGAAVTKIYAYGADTYVDLTVSRKRADEVVLDVGEWVRLSGPTHCLRLPAFPDAAYTLVYMDAVTIERAKTGSEGVWPEAHDFQVEDRSGISLGGTTTTSTARANIGVADLKRLGEAKVSTDVLASRISPFWAFERDRPWEPGETFEALSGDGREGTARVIGIWGKIVVAVFLADSAEWLTDARMAMIDSVMTFIHNEGVSILKAALGETHPYTSVDADQLLIMLSMVNSPYPGVTSSSGGTDVVESLINIDLGIIQNANLSLTVFGHEIAHAWQLQYLQDSRNSPDQLGGGATNWAAEGGATFLAYELVRHRIGIGLLDNWEWYPWLWSDNPYYRYAKEVADAEGYFLEGYEDAASFIRDQVTRLVATGISYEAAIAAVSRGVMDGWWGVDMRGVIRPGLTQRMRDLLDPEWNPIDAVLVWTASQALDEMIESDDFTNRSYKHVADVDDAYFPNCSGGTSAGWHSQGWLVAGRGYAKLGALGAWEPCFISEGDTFVGTLDRGMLSTFIYIEDDNVGGTYHLSGEGEMPEWMLVRYR